MTVFLAVTAAADILVRLTSASDVELKDRFVRLSDVAEISGTDVPAFNELIIAALKDSATPQGLRRIGLAQLVRRALPTATVVGDLSGSIRFHAPQPGVARPPAYTDERQIREGDNLTVTATVGVVAIRRQVVALQDATRRDTRVFVRSTDGEVFAAPIEAGAAQ